MNKSKGSLHNVLRDKRVMQWNGKGGVGGGEDGKQVLVCLVQRSVIIVVM